jgi:hypothetical protein
MWECGRCLTGHASKCYGKIILLGSMHLIGCYGCSVLVPQIGKSGGDLVLDDDKSLYL